MFYQKGTNHSECVCIAIGKHLKASSIEIDIPNTVVIDIKGLSEPVRIIGIYWPNSKKCNIDDILPLIVKGTVFTGDFNAAVKEWLEENKLKYTEPSPFLSFSPFFLFLFLFTLFPLFASA
jgi:hypothetical protein